MVLHSHAVDREGTVGGGAAAWAGSGKGLPGGGRGQFPPQEWTEDGRHSSTLVKDAVAQEDTAGHPRQGWRSSLVAQLIKDPALSWLWLEFDPWPSNFRKMRG